MSARFNAFGPNLRSCPICFRVGMLAGERDGRDLLECRGCARRFRFIAGTETQLPTLERVLSSEVDSWNRGARLADDHFCSGCFARGYHGICPRCEANDRRSARR